MGAASASVVERNTEHEALLSFLYLAPVGLAHCRLDGTIDMLNPVSAQLLLPLSKTNGLDNLFTALQDVLPDLRQRVAAYAGRHGRICDALRFTLPRPTPGNIRSASKRPSTLALTLLKLDDTRLMAMLDNVSEQVERERLLQQSRAWFDAILTGVEDYALVSLDVEGRILNWNESVGRVTGLTAAEVEGQPFSVFDLGSDSSSVLQQASRDDRLKQADLDGWSVDDGWRRRVGASAFWGTTLIAPIEPGHGGETGYHLILRDINDRHGAAEGLLRSINCDFLTGIANRRAFVEAANRELGRWRRTGTPLSLVVLDADNFKAVNDLHGHATGDAVLKQLAATIQAGFRSSDLVARIGGEEFAVLMPDTNGDAAMAVTQRVVGALTTAPLTLNSTMLTQTLSAGIAQMAAGIDSTDVLLALADTALYAAKAAGRNCVRRWDGVLP